MDAFSVVRAGYDAIGERYRDWSHLSPVRLHWVDRLQKELQPNSLVVDLGCGPGEPATRLLSERHRVIGVDASAAQLRLAQEVAPAALLLQADMTRLALRAGSVDAVASFYALGHVPSERHSALMSSIAGWLRPGGLLLTSAPLTPGDSRDDNWLGVPMFFGGIGEARTRSALADAGLNILDWQVVPEDEGDGHTVRFIWLLAEKRV
jgi:cyclopropane fatty-acyl-phospholipid synthase-like methyltransferase